MTGQPEGNYRERNSTADRALEILGLFDESRLLLSGSDVARELGVARSTAYRYLQSLVGAGFLEERRGQGFAIGTRVFELARLARREVGLTEIAVPVMRSLRDGLGETILLTRRSGSTVVCLEREETLERVRISYERGATLPLHAGASALVLLAWMPPDEARALLEAAPLEPFTDQTVTDVDALIKRLEQIRERGFDVSQGELDWHVTGIAAPIRDGRGEVMSAISVAAFSQRMSPEHLRKAVDAVRRAGRAIEDGLALRSA